MVVVVELLLFLLSNLPVLEVNFPVADTMRVDVFLLEETERRD